MAVSRDTTTSWDATAGDVPWQAWVTAINSAIVAAGCPVVADSGDLDPATTTFPAVEGDGGYRIYRFPDSDPEQAANPVFFKVNFQRGDAATELRLSFQVGKGSDGAGTLTSAGALASSTSAGSTDSADRLIHASFTDGELVFLATPNIAQSSGVFWLVVSRCKGEDGEFNGNVLAVMLMQALAGTVERWTGAAWEAGAAAGVAPVPHLDTGGAEVCGSVWPAGEHSPIRGVMVGRSSAFTDKDSGNVDAGGETRAMIATGLSQHIAPLMPSSFGDGLGGTVPACRTLLRNE